MKKIVLAFVLAVSLGGCAQLSGFLGTQASTANPVTPQMLYNVENGMIVAFAGLKAYKQSCWAGAIPPSCKGVIAQTQVYTRQIPTLLKSARAFVKNNDQVNAVIAYNAIVQLVSDFKSVALANNVAVGAK